MRTDYNYDGADVVRTCTRKKAYPSEKIAKLAITSIRKVNPSASVHTYACRHCGQWHVGGGTYLTVPDKGSETDGDNDEDLTMSRRSRDQGAYSRGRSARSGRRRHNARTE